MPRIAATLAIACLVALAATVTLAMAKPRTFDNTELKYSVTVPGECRVQEGPGTLEAICAPDFDEARSAEIPTATALLLEVDAEPVPSDAKAVYGEAEFRREVPEAVCGESDNTKVKIANLKETKDGNTTTFSASVVCPEIKFLGLQERRAEVRYIIAPNYRYRLMARAPASATDAVKAAIETFLQSFKATAEKKS